MERVDGLRSWRGRLAGCLVTLVTVLAAGAAGLAPVAAADAGAPSAAGTGSSCPWVNPNQPISNRVAELMSHMTLADEDTLVEGHGTTNPYVFYEPPIPSLCIPQLGMEDGPNGVADKLTGVTQLPAGVSLAATFDPSLAFRYGQVIGHEEWGKGAAVNLGPTINIDRDPRWGRSFETYTEDPFLNSSLATSEIDGVQSTGEMSQVKHYDAYNQETYRNTPQDDVIVSDRTLHEIYLPGFQAAIQKAKAGSVMCAYSMVNGNFSCENRYLETNVLDEMWGFRGFITSDYGALHSTTGGAFAGTDMEQPFNTYYGQPLVADVENGTIPRAVLNTMVERILFEMFRFNLFNAPPTGTTSDVVTSPGHVALSNQVAQSGTTLLKDSGRTLPISADHGGRIAVIGPSAYASPTYGGGGSAAVIALQTVSPLAGIESAAGHGTKIDYRQGLPTDTSLPLIPSSNLSPAYSPTPYGGSYTGTLKAPETGTYILALTNPCGCYTPTYLYLNGKELLDDPGTPPVATYSVAVRLAAGRSYSVQISGASSNFAWGTPSALAPGIAAAVSAAKSAKTAVVVVSDDTESEATDRPSLNLPSAQNELISAVAAANPHTVVAIDAGAPVAMPWLDKVAAVVDAWYPGQTNGTALADVLYGKVDPGGHLPVTFPVNLSQVPASSLARFPGVNGQVHYSEGLLVGYRWYDAQGIQPLFPFGFGLSYTRFAFSNLRVTPASVDGVQDVTVSATVKNAGRRPGSDVAQLYLGDPAGAGEPPRQLVGFQRVRLLPGQSTRVTFTVTPRDTWWWDESAGGWSQTEGTYQVYVGDSSALANLPLRGGFTMTSTPAARQVRIGAPGSVTPGKPATVTVTLTAGGDETLHGVRLALQLPQGWTAKPVGPTSFANVAPSDAPQATFRVTPPSYAPSTNEVVHATANLGGDAVREAGVTVTVS